MIADVKVICNGSIGMILNINEGKLAGMVNVWVPGGEVCVSLDELTRALDTRPMNNLKVRVYNNTKDSAKFNPNQTSWCQGVGAVPAIPAGELKPGNVIVYNTGSVSKVITVEPKGKASVVVSVLNHDGKIYEGIVYRRARLVPVVVTEECVPVVLPPLA